MFEEEDAPGLKIAIKLMPTNPADKLNVTKKARVVNSRVWGLSSLEDLFEVLF